MASSSSSLLLSIPFSAPNSHTRKFTFALHHRPAILRKDTTFLNYETKVGRFRSNKYVGILGRASIEGERDTGDELLIGEKSAEFHLGKQKITSWIYFGVVLGVVLFVLNVIWIDNSTGFGKDFVEAVGSLSDSYEVHN